MRRLVTLLTLSAALVAVPLAAPSSACAPPDEGPARCCEPPALVSVTLPDGRTVSVPDPFWDPRQCV